MNCAACQQLKADLEKHREGHSNALRKLETIEGRADSETMRMLRIRITEALLYFEMAHMELARHEALSHQANLRLSTMTA